MLGLNGPKPMDERQSSHGSLRLLVECWDSSQTIPKVQNTHVDTGLYPGENRGIEYLAPG